MTNESTTITDDAAPEAATTAEEVVTADPKAVRWYAKSAHGQTNFDRYIVPLLIPLTAVVGIIFYVVNFSRALISGTHTIALVFASVVTVVILAAAAGLSAASKMRSQTITIFSCVSMLLVMGVGLISVGHAQEEKAEAVVACEPIEMELAVATSTALKFEQAEYAATAGCDEITLTGPAGLHNLTFVGEKVPSGPVLLSGTSGKDKFAYTLEAGEYEFKCTVPGHEAMRATLIVT